MNTLEDLENILRQFMEVQRSRKQRSPNRIKIEK